MLLPNAYQLRWLVTLCENIKRNGYATKMIFRYLLCWLEINDEQNIQNNSMTTNAQYPHEVGKKVRHKQGEM